MTCSSVSAVIPGVTGEQVTAAIDLLLRCGSNSWEGRRELQVFEQVFGVFFAYGFFDVQDLDFDAAGAELDLDDVPLFDIHRGFGRFVIDQHSSGVAGFVGHGAAFDQAGNLQIFV